MRPRLGTRPGQAAPAARPQPSSRPALESMLEARSIALVGASPRAGTFGARMLEEAARSPARPRLHLVNPRYQEIGGRPCHPSLADLPEPVDLVLLGVRDDALEEQLALAAGRGDRSAVIFGNAHEDHPGAPAGRVRSAGPGSPPGLDRMGAASGLAGTSGAAEPEGSPGLDSLGQPSAPSQVTRLALRDRLADTARGAGMAMCGAGCMGFVNVSRGLRAIGYTEASPLPVGPVALVTHSGSVFSALLRTRRGLRFSLAVSSGQELVTTTPAYLDYALDLPETRVLALVLEAMRDAGRLREVLARAAERDIPVVALTVGRSASGQHMVAAHSGALAAADGGWEALSRAYGVHRVGDLAELADTLELFAWRRAAPLAPSAPSAPIAPTAPTAASRPTGGGRPGSGQPGARSAEPADSGPGRPAPAGIATVHDSGLERAHAADLAEEIGVPFAPISAATTARLAELLDAGLLPTNPLDVWGNGANTRALFAAVLSTLADDPAVAVVALAVDLVPELDGDQSYPLALLDAAQHTDKPLAVLASLATAIDEQAAAQLRDRGIPVLEGTRPGLRALGHLLAHARRPAPHPARRDGRGQEGTSADEDSNGQHHGVGAADVVRRPHLGGGTPANGYTDKDSSASADRASGPQRAERRRRARELLASGQASGAPLLALLGEYGIAAVAARGAGDLAEALASAAAIGYPVVLKTDESQIAHKSDVGGVLLGVADSAALTAGYTDLAARLGPRVLVCATAPAGTELVLGITRDPGLGPLIIVGAGGVLVELFADRAVALPPVDKRTARELISGLRAAQLLAGARGRPPAAIDPIVAAITGLSELACDLGDELAALDVNPLICGPDGAVAVDALALAAAGPPE